MMYSIEACNFLSFPLVVYLSCVIFFFGSFTNFGCLYEELMIVTYLMDVILSLIWACNLYMHTAFSSKNESSN